MVLLANVNALVWEKASAGTGIYEVMDVQKLDISSLSLKSRIIHSLIIDLKFCLSSDQMFTFTFIAPHPLILFVFYGFTRLPVKHVVLKKEHNVKDNGDVAETKLDRIANHSAPVVLQS